MISIGYVNPPYKGAYTESNKAEWNLVWMSIKSYYKVNGKYPEQINWVWPSEDPYDCDVVMFTSYMWNSSKCIEVAEKCKGVKIVGGPHIDYNNPMLFDLYPYDYYCQPTMPGEVFMTAFLDQYIEHGTVDPTTIPYEKRSSVKAKFEWPSISVYEDNIDWLKHISQYIDHPITLETTRGCPFKCTYCEWGGGLATKIIKKPMDIVKKDIDIISSLGIKSIDLADSNTGAYMDRDIEILDYIYDSNIRLEVLSTVKTPKIENKFKIIKACINKGFVPSLGLQSYSREALNNTKRVDISREDQYKLLHWINDVTEGQYEIELELILGLPGSTLEDFYQEFEWMDIVGAWDHRRYEYVILPFTESASPEDKSKYDVETTLVQNNGTVYETIVSCYSYSKKDMVEMVVINQLGPILKRDLHPAIPHINIVQFMKLVYLVISDLEEYYQVYEDINNYLSDPNPKLAAHIGNQTFEQYFVDFYDKTRYTIFRGLLDAL